MQVTDNMIEAAWEVLHDIPGWPPYRARARDYVTIDPGEGGMEAERQAQLDALNAADRHADEMNREVIRRVLAAALAAAPGATGVAGPGGSSSFQPG